jgi:hypothetical protein
MVNQSKMCIKIASPQKQKIVNEINANISKLMTEKTSKKRLTKFRKRQLYPIELWGRN